MAPERVFHRLLSGICEGRWPELADLYAPDVVVDFPLDLPQPTRLVGRESLRRHFMARAGGAFELRAGDIVVHTTADPEVVVAEWTYDVRNTATGRTFTVANVQVLRVRDGQIVASRDYHDHHRFALAASPS